VRSFYSFGIASGVLVLAFSFLCSGSDIIYPAKSGIVNVVTDHGVDNTGQSDVADTLSGIFKRYISNQVIYFPRGTYLVRKQIQAPICPNNAGTSVGPVIVGQSRKGTVIRLADGTWPTDRFAAGSRPDGWWVDRQVVLHGGDCYNTTFGKEIHNLTINVGRNNAGAVGVVFTASNYGCLSDLDIISEDGNGSIGIVFQGAEVGPAYARSVYVNGFKRGVFSDAITDMAFSQFVLVNQTEWGLVVENNCYVDSLSVSGFAPAVWNTSYGRGGRLVLINGFFSGNSVSQAAIKNEGRLFARNIRTAGYTRAITSTAPIAEPDGGDIAEYASHGTAGLFSTPGRSMNLPVKYPPFTPWQQDTTKWASTLAIKGGGIGQVGKSDSAALHTAFSTPGKTSVLVSFGRTWPTSDTLYVSGDIERVAGTVGKINAPAIVIQNNTPPVVTLQMLFLGQGPVIVRTDKTVILESVNGPVIAEGTGELYINDMEDMLTVRNPAQRVWVRKYNMERLTDPNRDAPMLVVQSGVAWIFSYKSEGNWVKAHCSGGWLELLGLYNYGSWAGGSYDVWPSTRPMVSVEADGQLSVAMLHQISHVGEIATLLVKETRGGQSRSLTKSASPDGDNISLFTGCSSLPASNAYPRASAPAEERPALKVLPTVGARLLVTFAQKGPSPVSVRLVNPQGRTVTSVSGISANGIMFANIDIAGLGHGVYQLYVKGGTIAHSQCVTIAR